MTEPLKVTDGSQKWKIGILLAFGVAVMVGGYFGIRTIDQNLGAEIPSSVVEGCTTVTVSTTTSTLVLAANSGAYLRSWANYGSAAAYLGFGTTTGLSSTSPAGYPIPAVSSTLQAPDVWTVENGKLYTGKIYGISPGTAVLNICDL